MTGYGGSGMPFLIGEIWGDSTPYGTHRLSRCFGYVPRREIRLLLW